ncbi:E3 ubiquitin/ISG15 ligase TRIM25-like [Carassius auratus]|uniref:E3 ubiquitin/ISG15 ligase TRIM25-like n=1 Tax=Carassius auratus TaxID=7957 RepID=A0A6P6Q1S8_CARAU|nr:E3 ubiquitin/ISG15 ligase TRIM25-like [Carassius auratus]
MSLKEEPESKSKRKRSESPEFTSTIGLHEHTDFSKESDHEHKNKRTKSERAHSPAPSYRSDLSMDPPTNFKSGETFGLNLRVKSERAASPAPSYMSLKTDLSMDPPTNYKDFLLDTRSERAPSPTLSLWSDWSAEPSANWKTEDTFPLDSKLRTSHHFKCPLCKSMLKDPVSISCGHNYCRGCINEFWDNRAGVYGCPQCGNPSETRPVLNTNAALDEVVKSLQQAGFSPVLPPQSYAGPEDVACDYCTEEKLKAVKCCLTCVMSLCETHVKSHYTIAALQKHTLSDVTGDKKSGPSEQHQNTDDSFSSTGQQDQTDTTQDVIEEEVGSISESTLNVCTSDMEVNKDTDVRSLALLCSKLQQDVAGLKKSLSNLNEKNTKKERYFEEDEEYNGEEEEEEDDDDHDDEEYNEKDFDEELDGDEDSLNGAEGYTDEEEEKEDSYDVYIEDYDDVDYDYSEDCDDEESSTEDEDYDEYN